MKSFRLSILVSLIVVLTSLTGGQVQIAGKVSAVKPEITKCIMLVKVVARQGSRALASGHELLDTTGVYDLPISGTIVPTQQRPVDIFVAGLGLDTMYVKSFYSFTGTRITLNIKVPNEYVKDASGNVVCPKCGGTEDILPVKYGTHHRIKRIIHNGDTTYVPLDHNIPSEMFSDLHPYWYCNKCKIQF